jgi:multidrug resistance efflux pump
LDVVCTGRVDVVGQVVGLDPSQPGRVVNVIKEGETVGGNAVLLELDDTAAKLREQAAKAIVDGLKADLERAKQARDRFPDQLKARKAVAEANAARVESGVAALRQKKAQSGVTGSTLTKLELEAIDAQIKELEATAKAEAAMLADLEKEKPELLVSAAQARLDAASADLQLAEQSVRECKLLAPGPGRILRVHVGKGGIIAPGGFQPAVVFAPEGGLIVRAEVDQEFLGRVKEGMTAEVQDDNRPDATGRTGKVTSIAKWVARRRSMVLEPGEVNDVRTVECVIVLDGGTADLFIGQRMRVRIKR